MTKQTGMDARGGTHLYDALVAAGIDLLVGVPGTQTLPLDRVVAERGEMKYVMARHETSVPHVAWGYYEASGSPAATLTIPGPGDTNSMHGLKNAAEDCVPLIHISADVNPEERGKSPIHEISPDTYDTVVKANYNVETPVELVESVERAIDTALTPPFGPVRLGVPNRILATSFTADPVAVEHERVTHSNESAYRRAVDLLRNASRPLIYIGGGSRRSPDGPDAVSKLARILDAPVLATYKGKGVFPEDDSRFLGVSGSHLPSSAEAVLGAADVVLALGTDFDGVTTANWSLPMGDELIHVNLDVSEIDVAYEADVGIIADVGTAVFRLLESLTTTPPSTDAWNGAEVATTARAAFNAEIRDRGLLADDPIQTPGALRTIRDVLSRDAVVTTDIGGFRLWANQVFEATDRRTYVTAGSWAGMGVGLPAAIGAKVARPEQDVVALTGDGGLMMSLTELHTAVENELTLPVVVFNNADYGVISQSPEINEYGQGRRFSWRSPEFGTIAEGFGCHGATVETRAELQEALPSALDADRPTLLDVRIPADEPTTVEVAEFDSSESFE